MFYPFQNLINSNTVPLYRLRNIITFDHFYTTSISEAMFAIESNYGYELEFVATNVATSTSGCLLKPVYRLFNQINDHLYTTSTTEGINGGYVSEGIAFYCAANAGECGATKAFHRYLVGTDHFYTVNAQEGFTVAKGGKYEGVLCYTWP